MRLKRWKLAQVDYYFRKSLGVSYTRFAVHIFSLTYFQYVMESKGNIWAQWSVYKVSKKLNSKQEDQFFLLVWKIYTLQRKLQNFKINRFSILELQNFKLFLSYLVITAQFDAFKWRIPVLRELVRDYFYGSSSLRGWVSDDHFKFPHWSLLLLWLWNNFRVRKKPLDSIDRDLHSV